MKDFAAVRLLVAGDVMLDRYWMGETSRISPEAPVPVVRVTHQEDRAGGAANVALNLASLKAKVALLGITGADSDADILTNLLQQAGVQSLFHASPQAPTIAKVRVMSRSQQLLRMDAEESLINEAEALLPLFTDALQQADLVILSDYAKGTLGQVQDLIQHARATGKKILIDPKGKDFSRYAGATLLTPNMAEFEAVSGVCTTEADIERKGQALRTMLDLEALLITRSEKGMTLIQTNQPALHLPAITHEVYDVTGAGDTVIAVLGLALAAGADYPQAMHLANLAASLVVSKPGTATLIQEELFSALQNADQPDRRSY